MVWIKSVVRLRVVPIYAMMVENLPPWARKEIDVIWRKFFWVASDADVRGKCMVAWPAVSWPAELNLKLTGIALQSRWLWLQRMEANRALAELPIKTDPEVCAFFKASTYIVIDDGIRTLFWIDS